MDNLVVKIALAFSLALIIGLAVNPVVIFLAQKIGFVAKPRADRWSRKPTALLGGIAIFLAAGVPWLVFIGTLGHILALGASALCIFAVGLVDDIFHLRPHIKLLGQIVAACLALGLGIQFGFPGSPHLIWPLTLLFIIGLTNAMNLLDNMDGLAAGVALVASVVIALAAFLNGTVFPAVMASALAGSCLAFLVFNFYPAKVFMGDCGSMFLGLALAVLAIETSASATTGAAVAVLFPALALSVPIFDTTFVTIVRKLNGRAISQGGCDHTSHRLVKLGLSERQTVLLLGACSLVLGALGLAAMRLDAPLLLLVGALGAAWLLALGRFLAQVEVYPQSEAARAAEAGPGVVLSGGRNYKRHFITALVDALLVFSAFLLAEVLISAGRTPQEANPRVLQASVWAVSGGVIALGLAGVYRDVRKVNASLMARLFLACVLSGAAGYLGLRVGGFSHLSAVMLGMVHSIAFFLLLAGVRWSYILFQMLLARAAHNAERASRLLIVADNLDQEEPVRKLIGRARNFGKPCGIVSVELSPRTDTSEIEGIPLIGRASEIEALIARFRASQVLVSGDGFSDVEQACRNAGVRFLKDTEMENAQTSPQPAAATATELKGVS